MQTDLFTIHESENNRESLNHVNENRKHFGKQAKKIYDLLMQGYAITNRELFIDHNIQSGIRRIHDLMEAGVDIQDDWNTTTKPATKFWYMSSEDRENNLEKFAQH